MPLPNENGIGEGILRITIKQSKIWCISTQIIGTNVKCQVAFKRMGVNVWMIHEYKLSMFTKYLVNLIMDKY